MLDENLTFDKIFELTFRLLDWISFSWGSEQGSRLNPYNYALTITQLRSVVFLQLLARLQRVDAAVEFYYRSKAEGTEFTAPMYVFMLFSIACNPSLFSTFSSRILGDMVAEGIRLQPDHLRALLSGAANCLDIKSAIQHFKSLELTYIQGIARLICSEDVEGYSISFLIRSYRLPQKSSIPQEQRDWQRRQRFRQLVLKEHGKGTMMRERIAKASTIPFLPSEVPETFQERVLQLISLMWYLTKKYPQLFTSPSIYNSYLSIAVQWGFSSAEAIFRDCYHHFPLTPEETTELKRIKERADRISSRSTRLFAFESEISWHWPLPNLSSADVPYLPQELPRPDKYTFMRALEYASLSRRLSFAHEVWALREAWKAHIVGIAQKDILESYWSKVPVEETLRYESLLIDNVDVDEERFRRYQFFRTRTGDDRESRLYEGYVRLLYIDTMASCGMLNEAFTMILNGTGERYRCTQEMLAGVRKYAKLHKHKVLCEYIDGLKKSDRERGKPDLTDELREEGLNL
jgi:hypothetical protein